MRFWQGCLLYLVCSTVGCAGESNEQSTTTSEAESTTAESPTTNGGLSYPDLYTTAGLPEYANATLIDTGRQTTSLRDGLKLTLESEDDVQAVAKFYEEEMKQLEWDVPEPKFRAETNYVGRYTKGNRYFQMTIMKLGDGPTKISISYAEN